MQEFTCKKGVTVQANEATSICRSRMVEIVFIHVTQLDT